MTTHHEACCTGWPVTVAGSTWRWVLSRRVPQRPLHPAVAARLPGVSHYRHLFGDCSLHLPNSTRAKCIGVILWINSFFIDITVVEALSYASESYDNNNLLHKFMVLRQRQSHFLLYEIQSQWIIKWGIQSVLSRTAELIAASWRNNGTSERLSTKTSSNTTVHSKIYVAKMFKAVQYTFLQYRNETFNLNPEVSKEHITLCICFKSLVKAPH